MARTNERSRRTLELVDTIVELLKDHGLDSALIGAMACAFYRYSRATEDVDLAVYADPVRKLPEVVRVLTDEGFAAEFATPDADDPLGGVITVTGKKVDPIQIVNFCNPMSGADNPGWESIQEAQAVMAGRKLRVVSLPHLIALKLYAGGAKSQLDVIELLERNAPLKLGPVRSTCRKFGLAEDLDAITRELNLG